MEASGNMGKKLRNGGLGVELKLGSGATSNVEIILSETSKEQEPTKPKIDLELSLSTYGGRFSTELKARQYFVRQMVELGGANFWGARRVQKVALTTALVTVVADDVSMKDALVPQEGGQACAFDMGVGKVVRWKTVLRAEDGTDLCISHGGGRRCQYPACKKGAQRSTMFCKAHGGDKRCKFAGCAKSAQVSTNFCKAHGRGKRCTWGQLGLECGDQAAVACDKYARGKSCLYAAHSAQLLDQQRNGGVVSPALQEPLRRTCKQTNGIAGRDPDGTLVIGSVRNGHGVLSPMNELPASFYLRSYSVDQLSLPEGRVHGVA
ncbi:putative wrky transcription factor 19 [Nicotiana attenuata]|uniref:Wrky transcription factor 19 n=1 Tax=Nicotiana attenuata TaxID=49451 RepID=A0A314L952_NICAT|nr:putative wrky transcription factor 19 [Nicotiana attenuata]